ncbi:class B sortase [Parabacteroides distasonis]|nr:class B sortase [Parabacteroides distasonis]
MGMHKRKTAIDYPVMHTPNDPKKYLYKNFNGQYSTSGTPFLDARCTINSSNCILYGHNMRNGQLFASLNSSNCILYGHNMRNGQLFASLKQYVDKSYYKKHPEVEFQTKKRR